MPVTVQIAAIHPRMGSAEMPWPTRKSAQAAGWDCVAAIDEPLVVWPGRLAKVPLGFALGLPEGWEAQVRPRSGLASKGLMMPNSPGTVDADYRGEVSALLFCVLMGEFLAHRDGRACSVQNECSSIVIHPGDRICQLMIAQVPDVTWTTVPRSELPPTQRGEGGFGSTGVGQSTATEMNRQ